MSLEIWRSQAMAGFIQTVWNKIIVLSRVFQLIWIGESDWVFPKIRVPQIGWVTMENPIKMDDLGIPFFLETPD